MAKNSSIEPLRRIQIKRRLAKVYNSLIARNVIESYQELAEQLELNASTVRGAFSMASPYLTIPFLEKLLDKYGDYFSRKWLYTGEGQMRARVEVEPEEAREERWKRVAHVLNQEGLAIPEFARVIGLGSPSTIYRIIRNKTKPSNSTLNLIYEKFPEYGRRWLLYGEGDPYIKPKEEQRYTTTNKDTAEPYKVEMLMEFAIIPDAAAAGQLTNFGDPDPEGFATMTLPVDREYKGNYYIFNVRGASMDDGTNQAICDGDRVLCREVHRDYWKAGLHRRTWPYFVFITRTEGIIIKEVVAQDLERDTITCHSINPDYDDIVLHLRDIQGIYNVVELCKRSMKR